MAAPVRAYEYGTPSGKEQAVERCLAIYRDEGSPDMDFSFIAPSPLETRIGRLRARIKSQYDLFLARVARVWLWNVASPVKTWFHFRFRTASTFTCDRQVIAALLRDAFAKEGITDPDFPYPVPIKSVKSASCVG